MFLGLMGPAHVRAAITQFYVPCLYLFICKTLLCLVHARVSAKERSNGAAAAGAEKGGRAGRRRGPCLPF